MKFFLVTLLSMASILLIGCDYDTDKSGGPLCIEDWCVEGKVYENKTGEVTVTDFQRKLINYRNYMLVENEVLNSDRIPLAGNQSELQQLCEDILSNPSQWKGKRVKFIGKIIGVWGHYAIHTGMYEPRVVLGVDIQSGDDAHVDDRDVEVGDILLFEVTITGIHFNANQHGTANEIWTHDAVLDDVPVE